MIRRALGALLVAVLVTSSAPRVSADPGGNQLTSWSALCTGVTESVFSWSGSTPSQCSSLPNRIVQWSDFTGNVTHTGTCGSGNPLPDWSQLLTCRGSGGTLTSQNFGPDAGVSYTSTYNSGTGIYTCRGGTGAASYTLTTPSSTVAPTSSAHQLTLTPSAVTGTQGSVSYTLKNPSGTVVTSGTIANGSTTPITYSSAGAAGGAWTWTLSTGAMTCDSTNGAQGTYDTISGSFSWYQ